MTPVWRRTRQWRYGRWSLYHVEVSWERREFRPGEGWLVARTLCGYEQVHVIGVPPSVERLDLDSVDENGARSPGMRRVVCSRCLARIRRLALVTAPVPP